MPARLNITFITGNASKAKHLSTYLGIDIAHKKMELDEIQSLNLKDVVTDKATRAYAIAQSPVLVEDVSLSFYSLGNLPGPLIKWFVQGLGSDGLCRLLSNDRRATAKVIFALYDGKQMHYFSGEREGTIAQEPIGAPRFAWDNIFIPQGASTVWSQMEENSFASSSMRAPAMDELRRFLNDNKERYL